MCQISNLCVLLCCYVRFYFYNYYSFIYAHMHACVEIGQLWNHFCPSTKCVSLGSQVFRLHLLSHLSSPEYLL